MALEQLRRGEIAAMIYVAGKPARLFSGLETGAGLRFLPLPATPAMLQTYQRARLSAADYPRLIGGGEAVETLSLGAVLAVYAGRRAASGMRGWSASGRACWRMPGRCGGRRATRNGASSTWRRRCRAGPASPCRSAEGKGVPEGRGAAPARKGQAKK
ncbi:TAXI family TRAP transporter solute-binding subunit [Teichococcus aestuarii]|uniref:hypothetical protein n=1 Tax=Teichococcus aestuarii TaxID=568898 RepID=UPI0036228239